MGVNGHTYVYVHTYIWFLKILYLGVGTVMLIIWMNAIRRMCPDNINTSNIVSDSRYVILGVHMYVNISLKFSKFHVFRNLLTNILGGIQLLNVSLIYMTSTERWELQFTTTNTSLVMCLVEANHVYNYACWRATIYRYTQPYICRSIYIV